MALIVGWFVMWAYRDGVPVAPQSVKRKEHVIYQTVSELESGSYADVIDRLYFDKVATERNYLVTVLETAPDPAKPNAEYFEMFGLNSIEISERLARLGLEQVVHHSLPTVYCVAQIYGKKNRDEGTQWPAVGLQTVTRMPVRLTHLNSEKGSELLAELFEEYGDAIDHVVSTLESRPNFAAPALGGEVFTSSNVTPEVSKMWHLGIWTRMRGEWKMERGDLEGAWKDIRASIKLSNHLNEAMFAFDLEVADWLRAPAAIAVVDLLNHPKMNEALFEEIAEEFLQLWHPMTGVLQLDIGERAKGHFVMNELLLKGEWPEIASRQFPELKDQDLVQGWVKSSDAMDEFNRCLDETIALLAEPPTDFRQEVMDLQARRNQRLAEVSSRTSYSMSEQTRRAVRILLRTEGSENGRSWLDIVGEVAIESRARCRLLGLVIALHRYARHQHAFPDTLEQLPGIQAEWLICPQTGQLWEYTVKGEQATLWGPGRYGGDHRGQSESAVAQMDHYAEVRMPRSPEDSRNSE